MMLHQASSSSGVNGMGVGCGMCDLDLGHSVFTEELPHNPPPPPPAPLCRLRFPALLQKLRLEHT